MKIFVIIVTYKGQQWYDKCFGSLRKSTIPVQTVVVDNSPGNEDAEYIEAHFPEVHIIKTNENLGFGKANNIGMRYALDNGCDYVFLLNQDAWLVQYDAFELLVNMSERYPEFGILSPMHLTADEKQLSIQYENVKHECSWNLVSDLYCGQMKEIYETDYINAAAWFLPRKTIETVGGFDPIFFLYGEDDNYLNRVLYHGFKIGVCPAIRIVHDHPYHESKQTNKESRRQKDLLVKWTNINIPFSYLGNCRYYMRKYISHVSGGKINQARQIRLEFRYLRRMYKKVKISRRNNISKSQSWLSCENESNI